MDAFLSRKRRRLSPPLPAENCAIQSVSTHDEPVLEEDTTDVKLAILSSLHPEISQEYLLDFLLSCDGSVQLVLQSLAGSQAIVQPPEPKRKTSIIGAQRALAFSGTSKEERPRQLTKKGRTLHLYAPIDIASHTPCSIIHNFLPSNLADDLLRELLPETESFESIPIKLFDKVVKSPHTACFYVDNLEDRERQKNEYLYNGIQLEDIRQILPIMRKVGQHVQEATNKEIAIRIRDHYPNGQKLKYQTPKEWKPNAAFVNCYNGPAESVGWHTDQLTYLGPHASIASLSLGVAREFRVRKIVPKDENDAGEAADTSGQIAIHLPHNSLLVMHAEMQEEWKHSIAPAQAIDPHPIAGNKRVNITYRWYREELDPKYTPKCKCGVPTVLKAVMRQRTTQGRYMWMCQMQGRPGLGKSCGYFEWAKFTEDGEPIWSH